MRLKQSSPDNLAAYWDNIITDANNSAWEDIREKLGRRGFTETQIDTWDRSEEFNKDIGLYWCLVKGGVGHNYDDRFIRQLDRRAELETIQVTIAGAVVQPGDEDLDAVGHGKMLRNDEGIRRPTGEWRKW